MTDKITRRNAPSSVQVQRVPFSSQQQVWLEKAYSSLDVERAVQLNLELTNIYSYTGFEKEINEFIVDYWNRYKHITLLLEASKRRRKYQILQNEHTYDILKAVERE